MLVLLVLAFMSCLFVGCSRVRECYVKCPIFSGGCVYHQQRHWTLSRAQRRGELPDELLLIFVSYPWHRRCFASGSIAYYDGAIFF